MIVTLAKFYSINLASNWWLQVVLLLAAIVLAALTIWLVWKRRE
jgi:uncharacterized membrane protein